MRTTSEIPESIDAGQAVTREGAEARILEGAPGDLMPLVNHSAKSIVRLLVGAIGLVATASAEAAPDLMVEGLLVTPTATAAGTAVTVSYAVVNRGSAPVVATSARPYTDRIYLSADAALDTADTLLAVSHGHTADLSPGERHVHRQALTVPATTAPGDYFILVQADALARFVERDEDNNISAFPVTVDSSPPLGVTACDQIGVEQFFGCYYDTATFTALRATRMDPEISFRWQYGAPAPTMGVDTFSVRWTGDWTFSQAGTYRFTLTVDDGARLFIDGVLVFESWRDQAATTYTVHRALTAGSHRIRLDYYERTGRAVAELTWAKANAPVPSQTRGSMHELLLAASGSYTNPFTGTSVTTTFIHTPSHELVTVHGFYDGDGAGGQTGNVWRVRFLPPRAGSWTWTTASADAGLNNQSGVLTAQTPPDWRLQRGVSPYLHLPRIDGGHTFTIGLWILLYLDNFYDNRDAILDHLQAHGVNRIRGKVSGNNHYGAQNNKFVGGSFDTYRLSLMVKLDAIADALEARRMYWDPHIFSNDDEAAITEAQAQRFTKYMIARYGAYAGVSFTIHNQADSHFGGSIADAEESAAAVAFVDDLTRYAQTVNPHGILLHPHDPGEDHYTKGRGYYLPHVDDWPFDLDASDFICKQLQVTAMSAATTLTGNQPNSVVLTPRGLARLNSIVRGLRARYRQAVSVDEYSFVPLGSPTLSWHALSPTGMRKSHWVLTTAGASGAAGGDAFGRGVTSNNATWPFSAKGAEALDYLKVIADTMRPLPFWRMVPNDAVVSPMEVTIESVDYRTNFALASRADSVFLIYSLLGGDVTVTLPTGRYRATQINPSTGETTSLGALTGGATVLSLPTSEPPTDHNTGDTDWVVLIEGA